MGFFKAVGKFLFTVLECSAKSSAQHRYDAAKQYSRNSSLTEEQRAHAQKVADNAKRDLNRINSTQASRNKFKNDVFGK